MAICFPGSDLGAGAAVEGVDVSRLSHSDQGWAGAGISEEKLKTRGGSLGLDGDFPGESSSCDQP